MKFLSRSRPGATALLVLLTAGFALTSFGQDWQELGNVTNSLDKAYINVATVSEEDGLRIVLIKTVYPEPRPNKSNITLDSHIQETAFDCENKKVYGIQVFGYLNGKQVGTSPLAKDWKTRLVPVGKDSFSQHVLSTACTLQVRKVILTASPAPQSPTQTPFPTGSLQDENLLFAPPSNFKIGYRVDRNLMTDFVPSGETVDDWNEMLTVQVFRNLKDLTAAAFLQNVGGMYLKACPDTAKNEIVTGKVNSYAVSMLALKCPSNPKTGKPETTVFRAIRGKDALYVVQHAWKTVPSDGAKRAISTSSVCDTRDPEHPCPQLSTPAPSVP